MEVTYRLALTKSTGNMILREDSTSGPMNSDRNNMVSKLKIAQTGFSSHFCH